MLNALYTLYAASYFHNKYMDWSVQMRATSAKIECPAEAHGSNNGKKEEIQASCYKRSTGGSPDNTFNCQIWKLQTVEFSFLNGG
jgi:hypothetical protein